MVSIIFEHIECENKMMILFFFFPFFIRYLAHLHFQCYTKSAPKTPPPPPPPPPPPGGGGGGPGGGGGGGYGGLLV